MGGILHHTLVAAPTVRPRAWLPVLHGFLGAGRNWATVARRLTGARQDWGAALVDLRLHGASQGFAPPHTLAACAADLMALTGTFDRPAAAALGHSFGGKVALTYLMRRPRALRQVWIIDTDPSGIEPRGEAWNLLRTLRTMPQEYGSREDFIAALLGKGGGDRRTAEWMATNLQRNGARYRLNLDLEALEQLLLDGLRADLWGTVEQPPPGVGLHFVKATRSTVLSGRALTRLRAGAAATAAVMLHEVEGGHWLNADNAGAMVALLSGGLPRCA
jgi:pimeloyl-ACP methyl ester carboxylesterase